METPRNTPPPVPGLDPHCVFSGTSPNLLPCRFGLCLSLSQGARAELLWPFCCFELCSSPPSPGQCDPSTGAAPQRAGAGSSLDLGRGNGNSHGSSPSPGAATPCSHLSTSRTHIYPDGKVPSQVQHIPALVLPRSDLEALREQQLHRAADPRQRPCRTSPRSSSLLSPQRAGGGMGSWALSAAASKPKAFSSSSCHQGLGCAVRVWPTCPCWLWLSGARGSPVVSARLLQIPVSRDSEAL